MDTLPFVNKPIKLPITLNSIHQFQSQSQSQFQSLQSLGIYLQQYLSVATGRRVKLQDTFNNFLRFKCGSCSDNWNVGIHLFFVNGQQTVPTELTDWVVKHEHVCKNYLVNSPDNLPCLNCGWAYHKHQEAQPLFDVMSGKWIAPEAPKGPSKLFVPTVIESAVPTINVRVAKQVTGRKFRD